MLYENRILKSESFIYRLFLHVITGNNNEIIIDETCKIQDV